MIELYVLFFGFLESNCSHTRYVFLQIPSLKSHFSKGVSPSPRPPCQISCELPSCWYTCIIILPELRVPLLWGRPRIRMLTCKLTPLARALDVPGGYTILRCRHQGKCHVKTKRWSSSVAKGGVPGADYTDKLQYVKTQRLNGDFTGTSGLATNTF